MCATQLARATDRFVAADAPAVGPREPSIRNWKTTEKETADGFDVWIFDTGGEPRVQNLRRGGIWLRPKGEPLGIVVYVVVNDIEATLKRVTELGGKAVSPKAPVGAGYAAYFTDPSGNLLALYEDKSIG